MRILSIPLEKSRIGRTDLLDWLTDGNIGGGRKHERYWILNTSTDIQNIHNEPEVERLRALLYLSMIHDFQLLMICSNSMKSEEKSEMNSSDSNQKTTTT